MFHIHPSHPAIRIINNNKALVINFLTSYSPFLSFGHDVFSGMCLKMYKQLSLVAITQNMPEVFSHLIPLKEIQTVATS